MCKAAEKRARRPAPPKIIIRSNHWSDDQKPPSQFAKVFLVCGNFDQLLDEVTRRLEIPISVQYLYHADDRLVTGVDDIKDGETLYTVKGKLEASNRDWGKTLCPQKRKCVVVHLNHWSDAPAPSRYTQKVLVPDNLDLLNMRIT